MKKQKINILKPKEVAKALKSLPSWKVNAASTVITSTFTFDNQIDALTFIARVTVHAQVLAHYPEITFTFKKVKISLTSPEVKALTKVDVDLAKRIGDLL